ncbi:hypothetical protein FHS68_002103 [Dyadobacter arcticus]|uniref:Uncharacterized protein n=1 Tax=Dyadobacter arcticus TaxID=1078754 RepID=A0ABX0UKD3_9BACT|nr:hypothetical protein [Dyadobacter arcticus]
MSTKSAVRSMWYDKQMIIVSVIFPLLFLTQCISFRKTEKSAEDYGV